MTSFAHIDRLWIANLPRGQRGDARQPDLREYFGRPTLLVDTCLRQLCIGLASDVPKSGGQAQLLPGLEVRRGVGAYRYALEVATGLRSAVPGETNVFGQFRQAWDRYRHEGKPDDVARIAPFVRRLIIDVRCIRRDHLQGIGGSSYGTLVRRLVSPRRGERLLFVGAGDLSRSMWPVFADFDVGVWNHRRVEVADASDLTNFAPGRACEAAAWADHVVFTTPPDRAHDVRWRLHVAAAGIDTLVHLGHRRGGLHTWAGCRRAFDLDDVFELRSRQARIRSDRLESARIACREAARGLVTERERAHQARLTHA